MDSFTYAVTDPAGKVSREATVTIQILKPTDDRRYADTAQFEAEWLRNTGIFEGEKLGGQLCFQPEKTVTRGEFLTLVMQLLDIPVSNGAGAEDLKNTVPSWLQPYLTAAMRSGLMTNFPEDAFDAPISGQEAAVILQNALDLPTVGAIHESPAEETALAVLNQNGLLISDSETLTRSEMAQLLYQVSQIAPTAPGLMVFRQM